MKRLKCGECGAVYEDSPVNDCCNVCFKGFVRITEEPINACRVWCGSVVMLNSECDNTCVNCPITNKGE